MRLYLKVRGDVGRATRIIEYEVASEPRQDSAEELGIRAHPSPNSSCQTPAVPWDGPPIEVVAASMASASGTSEHPARNASVPARMTRPARSSRRRDSSGSDTRARTTSRPATEPTL